jgi:hypothetical protein
MTAEQQTNNPHGHAQQARASRWWRSLRQRRTTTGRLAVNRRPDWTCRHARHFNNCLWGTILFYMICVNEVIFFIAHHLYRGFCFVTMCFTDQIWRREWTRVNLYIISKSLKILLCKIYDLRVMNCDAWMSLAVVGVTWMCSDFSTSLITF